MMDEASIAAHRARALDPEHPVLRGTAQNPDAFFQAREACNSFYAACPEMVQEEMDRLAGLTGRRYHLVDYHGHPEAERVVVAMGSGAEVAHETVDWLVAKGERVGVLKIRLYRPFPAEAFLAALPRSVRAVAVLDRTKEPGAPGEPLYLDVLTTLAEARAGRPMPTVVGGRYGLSSKEFDPGMVRAVFENARSPGAEEPLHRGHRGRRHPDCRSTGNVTSRSRCPAAPRRCSTASARTGPSARTRPPSRSSARRPTTQPRATSSTTRRSRAR